MNKQNKTNPNCQVEKDLNEKLSIQLREMLKLRTELLRKGNDVS